MTDLRRHMLSIVVAVGLCLAAATAAAAADSVLYRLFLQDGTTLVSFGEFARVGDRVVFSMPVGPIESTPALQVVSIPQSAVDWERTDRYSDAVRLQRYAETRGESDFAMLGGRVTEALNLIALTTDPVRRLAMAQEARANLARWPAENFGYRAKEVGDLVGMIDEVIADLRVATGQKTELALVATTVPQTEPLLPPPDLRETMEEAFAAAAMTPDTSERMSLLSAVAAGLQEPARQGGWAAELRARASLELGAEMRTNKAYADLSSSTIALATARAARADVIGVQRLLQSVLHTDDRLGRLRPQETAALLAMLDLRLDEARRLRLARDAWALRLEAFRSYRAAIATALGELRRARTSLVAIRELSGPPPSVLPHLDQRLVMARQRMAGITAPVELEAAHGLFVAAFRMADRATSLRRNAVLSGDMKIAWDASSAASGALMLLDRAAAELDRLATPPSKP